MHEYYDPQKNHLNKALADDIMVHESSNKGPGLDEI